MSYSRFGTAGEVLCDAYLDSTLAHDVHACSDNFEHNSSIRVRFEIFEFFCIVCLLTVFI